MKLDFGKEMVWESLKIVMIAILASVALTYAIIMVVGIRHQYFWDHLELGLYIAGIVAFCVGFPVSNIIMQQNRSLKVANKKLHKLIRFDQLTGLLSRATFFGEVDEQQKNNGGQYNAVFFMDFDHFKKINDQYGHGVGDEFLRRFGALVINQLEDGEMAGRLGGEEFAIYIPNCTRQKAEIRAELLAQALSNELICVGDKDISCTVSIGIYVDNNQVDLDTMLSEADGLMYKAKKGGRNRVVAREVTGIAA